MLAQERERAHRKPYSRLCRRQRWRRWKSSRKDPPHSLFPPETLKFKEQGAREKNIFFSLSQPSFRLFYSFPLSLFVKRRNWRLVSADHRTKEKRDGNSKAGIPGEEEGRRVLLSAPPSPLSQDNNLSFNSRAEQRKKKRGGGGKGKGGDSERGKGGSIRTFSLIERAPKSRCPHFHPLSPSTRYKRRTHLMLLYGAETQQSSFSGVGARDGRGGRKEGGGREEGGLLNSPSGGRKRKEGRKEMRESKRRRKKLSETTLLHCQRTSHSLCNIALQQYVRAMRCTKIL